MDGRALRTIPVTTELWGGREETRRSTRFGPLDEGHDFHMFLHELHDGDQVVGYESSCRRRFWLGDGLVTESQGRNGLADWADAACETCLRHSMSSTT